ncbi:class I SAM-dependent methyltransferase [Solidesulfovibrio sp.]
MTDHWLCQVFRIREDGVYNWDDTPLARSLDALDRADCPRSQLAMPAAAPVEVLLAMLDEAVVYAKAPWIQIAVQGLETTSGLYDALARTTGEVARLPLVFASETGDRLDPTDDAAASGESVAALFSRLVWRRDALAAFIGRARGLETASRRELALLLETVAADAPPLDTPPLHCLLSPRGEALFQEGEMWLRRSDPAKAVAALNAAKRMGCGRDSETPYLKALAKAGLRRLPEARVHAEAAIAAGGMTRAAWQFLRELMPYLPADAGSYAAVRTAVESAGGDLAPGQAEFLHNLVLSLPNDAKILEVGGSRGRSTTAMAFACAGTARRIVTVAPFFDNDGPLGCPDSVLDVWQAQLADFDLERFVTPRPGWTHAVLCRPDAPRDFDFAVIDGSHDYADVLRDFETIYPLVKPGGFIALHAVEPGWPGPWRVWRQVAALSLVDHAVVSTLSCGRKPVDRNEGSKDRPWPG